MTEKIILKMIKYFGNDTKRINHALKVYSFAHCIALNEGLSAKDLQIVDIVGAIHDIGIKEAEKKHNSSIGHYQEIEGPAVANDLLSEFELSPETIDRVCYIIGNHHTYTKIDGLDFQILVEADFLVNIFEDEISIESVNSIRKKYFVTQAGKSMLESMYLKN